MKLRETFMLRGAKGTAQSAKSVARSDYFSSLLWVSYSTPGDLQGHVAGDDGAPQSLAPVAQIILPGPRGHPNLASRKPPAAPELGCPGQGGGEVP